MKKKEAREYLYRVFRKTIASFMANVYKASITGSFKDIHRARLDVKRAYALFSFFEMLHVPDLDTGPWYRVFRPIYRQAGRIREIQVHYLLLEETATEEQKYEAFTRWLQGKEQRAVSNFIRRVKEMKDGDLKSLDRTIGTLCSGSAISRIKARATEFLVQHATTVRKLQEGNPDDTGLHTIRKQLKIMSTVATLVYTIKPGNNMDAVIAGLNRTEMMIGNWHDRIVLKETLGDFLSGGQEVNVNEKEALEKLKTDLDGQCINLVAHFTPGITEVLDTIMGLPFSSQTIQAPFYSTPE